MSNVIKLEKSNGFLRVQTSVSQVFIVSEDVDGNDTAYMEFISRNDLRCNVRPNYSVADYLSDAYPVLVENAEDSLDELCEIIFEWIS